MTSFIQKKLPSAKNLPEALKEERLKRQLSLEELSFKTQISLKYLEALERGFYHLLPGEIYTQQFIKKLAKFFRLNEKSLREIYQQEKKSQPSLSGFSRHPKTEVKTGHWLSPKTIRNFLIIFLIMAFGGYFGLEIKNIFTPPLLEVYTPLTQTITTQSTIEIQGKTEPETTLQINQQEVLTDSAGNFSQTVDLTIGLNIFKISAGKKHSLVNELTISILRQPLTTAEINLKTESNQYRVVNN